MRDLAAVTWHAVLEDGDGSSFRLGRAGDDLVAEWVGLATLRARRTGEGSELSFEDHVDPRWRRKLERGLARGMLRQLRGELTLHASAVHRGEAAVLLIGKSGAGKSTMAAALVRRGFGLLADDAAPISFDDDRSVRVEPSDAEIWLWSESRNALGVGDPSNAKRPVECGPPPPTPKRLVAAVVLEFAVADRATSLRELRGTDALAPLLSATVRMVVDEPDVQLREVEALQRFVRDVPTYALERPRDFAALDASVQTVVSLLEKRAP